MDQILVVTTEDLLGATLYGGLKILIDALPQATRDLLKLGPIDDNEGIRGCRLCDTMDETIDRNDLRQMEIAIILLDYHDIDGSAGPACYRRCCQIYRAAGWRG